MAVDTDYLGMNLVISDLDSENAAYFDHCRQHQFHLQQCRSCSLVRYPPSTACPFCRCPDAVWFPVEPKGVVYSYTRIHHVTNAAFKPFAPYMVAIVDLDMQRDVPQGAALRIPAVVANADGQIASRDETRSIGINSRMRMIFRDVCDQMALPLWVAESSGAQTGLRWIFPPGS